MKFPVIDLRSDTVTKPSAEMRKAIADAVVGDDVFGEDPSVNRLQKSVAALLGKEDALFTPTGVMANQIAIKCHTQAGDEVIVERDAHILNYETGAPAMLSGVQLLTITGNRGIIRADQLEAAIRPPAYYMTRTSLLCLENTHNRAGGTVYPLDEIKRIRSLMVRHNIPMHLDGARLWNAWVASGVHAKEYARFFDSVSVCFSKGLGAPVGSAVAGSKEFIARARKVRKIFGGGMRQAGILAAAAQYAVDHNIKRLKDDHEKARVFAAEMARVKGFSVDMETVQTNIVIIDVSGTKKSPSKVLSMLRLKGVLLTEAGPTTIRAVTHMDVSMDQVRQGASIIQKLFS
jgi:threonine aldolase